MVKCPQCGAEIKYIPVDFSKSALGAAVVEAAYTEIINDHGRIVKGHLRHQCKETAQNPTQ